MKTKKIYKAPKCKAIRLDTEDLCDGGGMGMYNSYTEFQGAKKSQYVYDDEVEENPEYEL